MTMVEIAQHLDHTRMGIGDRSYLSFGNKCYEILYPTFVISQ